MSDDHESAVAAWLADPTTQREIGILKQRFPSWRESDVYLFAVLFEVREGMDFYGIPLLGPTDEDDDSDATTGWKP